MALGNLYEQKQWVHNTSLKLLQEMLRAKQLCSAGAIHEHVGTYSAKVVFMCSYVSYISEPKPYSEVRLNCLIMVMCLV